MDFIRMDMDIARHHGADLNITSIWYIGHPDNFSEFCEFVYTKYPNLINLKVNRNVDTIPDKLCYRLKYLDCANSSIKSIYYGPHLEYLNAADTKMELSDVLSKAKKINYLKIGSIYNNTRLTIDSHNEYIEFLMTYVV